MDPQDLYQRSLDQLNASRQGTIERNFATAQQDKALSSQRQLRADQFGYDAALQGQQGGIEWDRDHARYQHDDELFDRHQSGQLAEMHLQQLQQQKMAQFQAQQEQQRLVQQQDFQGQMAQYEAGVQDQRLSKQQDFDAAKTGFEAGVGNARLDKQQDFQQQQELERQQHEVVLNQLALRGREAQEEILHRHQEGTLSQQHSWRVDEIKQQRQEEQDKYIVEKLSSGEFEIGSPDDQQQLANNANARARIRNSNYLDDDAKQKAIEDTFKSDAQIRRSASPVPPEKRAAMYDARLQKMLGDKYDEKKHLYAPNKFGQPEPNRVLSNDELGWAKINQQPPEPTVRDFNGVSHQLVKGEWKPINASEKQQASEHKETAKEQHDRRVELFRLYNGSTTEEQTKGWFFDGTKTRPQKPEEISKAVDEQIQKEYPQGGQQRKRSPDGKYEWDGKQWVPVGGQ